MRKLTYLAIFETDDKPGLSVYFPDVPGCISCGDTFDHALAMAREALSLHIYGLEKDGDPLPERTDRLPDTGHGDLIVPVTVYPDMVKTKLDNRAVRTNVTLPAWLKELAEERKVNYSQVLETALKELLNAS
jgi:predicted RNase H-like HicB family nuclease